MRWSRAVERGNKPIGSPIQNGGLRRSGETDGVGGGIDYADDFSTADFCSQQRCGEGCKCNEIDGLFGSHVR